MEDFKNWREIQAWAVEHGFDLMARRMQINNDCWMSSGEFGRSQVRICDAMRFAGSEAERVEVAEQIEAELQDDWLLMDNRTGSVEVKKGY